VASGGGFNPGDEVILTNGVSSGVHLRTVVTAVNVAGNTVTLLNASTNTGTTVLGTIGRRIIRRGNDIGQRHFG
jgi:hypothetical protein